LAGPNGSGKSTVTKGIRQVLQLDNWIDPDVVAEEVRAEQGASLEGNQISELAFKTARNRRIEYGQNLENFGFETVFSHISSAEFLDALKVLGYVVHLYFVCTDDPQINIGRVRNRHSLGGHDVPEDKIVSRYYRSLENLRECVRRFDRVVLIDNSGAYGRGQALGQILNVHGRGSKVELFPRPSLPDWLLGATQGFGRHSVGRIISTENRSYRGSPERTKDLLAQFVI
jgi:predicted ABC-type ATPase